MTATAFLCATCGIQHAPSVEPPASCAICEDERQYVPDGGQRWTTLQQLARTHRNAYRRLEPDLLGIGMEPAFAIGQRALIVRTPAGNILRDCIALLDEATIDIVRALGGLTAIAVSHPHFYTTMVEWAHAFDCPIHLHEHDRRWALRPDPSIEYWSGDTYALPGGSTLIRVGGHFAGGTVMHWPAGADGRGALLTGDLVQVNPDRASVSFMRSYPNLIPLAPPTVEAIVDRLGPYRYDRIYGAWWDRVIERDGEAVVRDSARRYIHWATTADDA